jgi:hypothetical protein|tara:strand:- start:3347 stop:4054 length:708 start_codon:yes stop_codon:yes gene_type:complete
MNNNTLLLKLKQRLNKLDSQDYDNIECWQFVEAFNKSQLEWCRRNLHGGNMYKEGDELSKKRIDDLQPLLIELSLTGSVTDTYFESNNFPVGQYLEYKRVNTDATSECCTDPRSMTVYLSEVANVPILLRDPLKNPDFEWGETFCTMQNNTIRIYRDTDFNIVNPVLVYYRKPIYIEVLGCTDPYTGVVSTVNIECEFKDDLVEVMLDDTAALIAGDIENIYQQQRGTQAGERNN